MTRTAFVALAALVIAAGMSAQGLTVGNNVTTPNSSDGNIGVVRTVIDLAHPANATGNLTSATFYWANTGCTNAVKVKVFRRVGDTFTLVAERGPFSPTSSPFTTPLSPPAPVLQGDLIALSRVANCGNAGVVTPGWQNNFLRIVGEPSSFTFSQAEKINATLAVGATGNATESIAGVIPAVASNRGTDAFFRTTLQMMAHPPVGSTPTTGKLVFHRLGVPGSPTDVSLPFSIMPGQMQFWDDILVSAGVAGAPASVDVVMPWGRGLPVVTTHLYNDMGASGTTGFRQDVVDLARDASQVFVPGMWGYLLGPVDATTFRCNIGIRSLEAGVEGTLQVRRADGTSLGTRTFRYGPNTYDQKSFSQMTGVTLEDGLTVQVVVSTGKAIVYASVVDNQTGDPANVLGRTYEGII
ncbi:MAG TPA: hypothetical protein PLS53_04710 [Thermoanaerobaculaceae bacterium]|nr:hypothetical protein [Thermoanaerobaculaceae bacterium]HPS77436.1 hypothetical protein [Thermoanaerobaculaceae bacterium]